MTNSSINDITEFCNKYPLNYYECCWCGQHDKTHEDPKIILEEDRCFRCGFHWKIREGTEMRFPGYLNATKTL